MTLMGLGLMPPSHPLYLGMLGMHATRSTNFILEEADLLIVLGRDLTIVQLAKQRNFALMLKLFMLILIALKLVRSNALILRSTLMRNQCYHCYYH